MYGGLHLLDLGLANGLRRAYRFGKSTFIVGLRIFLGLYGLSRAAFVSVGLKCIQVPRT